MYPVSEPVYTYIVSGSVISAARDTGLGVPFPSLSIWLCRTNTALFRAAIFSDVVASSSSSSGSVSDPESVSTIENEDICDLHFVVIVDRSCDRPFRRSANRMVPTFSAMAAVSGQVTYTQFASESIWSSVLVKIRVLPGIVKLTIFVS